MSRNPVPATQAAFANDRRRSRLPPLAVPGANVVAMYADGELLPTECRAISDDRPVRSVAERFAPPTAAMFTVEVPADPLSRKSGTARWTFVTAACTPLAGAIAVAITALLTAHKPIRRALPTQRCVADQRNGRPAPGRPRC